MIFTFISDEPGYYVPNKFGIRLENICFSKIADVPYNEEEQNFLEIETITLVPYEPKLIAVDLLNNRQRNWLNKYHSQVENVIGRELEKRGETDAYNWLIARTKPIPLLGNSSARSAGVFFVSLLSTFVAITFALL